MTTGIGSLPHTEASEAVDLSLKALDAPFWPQLPALSFLEQMIPQYTEGMPSVRMDAEDETVWFERDEEEIERFYETSGNEAARVAISDDYSKGFYSFMDAVKGRRFKFLKGHITGPMTFTLGLKDQDGKLLYYDEELREIALMLLAAKARWQIDMLSAAADEVIIFIDEPILSALGTSAYLGVDEAETRRMLSYTVEAIQESGSIAGIHCCGRADWPLVMSSGVDIMNFDAYSFGDTLAMYPDETESFLDGGGWLAWGIVPTSEEIQKEDEQSVVKRYTMRLAEITKTVPENKLMKSIMLTPSCGTGSRTVEETTKIFQILMRLKEAVAR
jgi:methionine synthase II (cobalamin-independent)